MPNIKIGSKTFTDVENINLPLADGTGQASFGTGGSQENIEWHQCPEAVRNYLDNVTYDPDDYSVSYIADYAPSSPVVSNYKPVGKTIGNKTFYNEVPNVETPYQTDGKYGTAKPLDQVRYINTPSAPNVRDLGGWTCDGGTVKYGLLYRGGYLSAVDRDVLVDELGIRHDLDLRGTSEANSITKSPLGDGVYYTCAEKCNWYSLSNKEAWKTNLRCVFDAVMHNKPLYFHCAAGADRTGTLACILEGLLGVSQSDIDKDYELTCFYSGTGTDNQARRRNETNWTGLINTINTYDGDTFRDKCITFVLQLGFTADEINAYRKAVINGDPEEIVVNVDVYTISNILTNVKSSNNEASIVGYQPYEATITCGDGYVIDSVKILCDGTDITKSVWKGTVTNLNRTVKTTLEGCTANYARKKVIDGQSYATTITALTGYTLDGAEVLITMGGVDVSKYYKNGVIAIPNVTGDIEIAITAVKETLSDNLVDIYGIAKGFRISMTTGENTAKSDACTVGATNDADGIIPYEAGDIFYIKGATYWPSVAYASSCVCWYEDLDGTRNSEIGVYLIKDSESLTIDDNGVAKIDLSSHTTYAGLRITVSCDDPTQLIIQKNKPIE